MTKELQQTIKRAEIYSYIGRIRRMRHEGSAMSYLKEQKYLFHLRKARKELEAMR
jgi:superfamily II DNA/RNA helicase